jgi:hypothetical protein
MIILESRMNGKNQIEEGYFLSIEDLGKLVRDFQADCFDGFVSNDHSYIEHWLKKHESIRTSD